MVSDEPWSRAGDYVLLRALTDIVCVSSACPDDTTPANGWNLTDIHVRTYSGQHKFSRAIARRMTPDSEPKMTRETAFHSSFAKHATSSSTGLLAGHPARAGPSKNITCRRIP
jgi:aminomethyltransferase